MGGEVHVQREERYLLRKFWTWPECDVRDPIIERRRPGLNALEWER